MPQNHDTTQQRRLFYVGVSLAILCVATFAFVFRAASVSTERYYSSLVKKNEATSLLAGAWARENSSTQMVLYPNGTGIFRSKSGDESHFDWTCDSTEFHLVEYNTPVVSLVKIKRIATMDTSMTDKCSIVKLDQNELELRYIPDPSIVVRYSRLSQP
jgi:hypothetical protein